MAKNVSIFWTGFMGQLQQVSRATFTSETLACINAVDHLIVLAILLHHMLEGAVDSRQAVELPGELGKVFETGVNIDAMSVLTALESATLRQLQEGKIVYSENSEVAGN